MNGRRGERETKGQIRDFFANFAINFVTFAVNFFLKIILR